MPTLYQSARPLLFALSVVVRSAQADYYIDDTNTTLTYSSGTKDTWGSFAAGGETLQLLLPNGTWQTIDPSVCYNHTYHYGACFSTDSWVLKMPFTGSGITVFVYQAGPVGMNASISVDGSHTETNVLSVPPSPNYEMVNVSMFDIQVLQTGSHTLLMTVNNFFESYSGMMFDYAYVNETFVSAAGASDSQLSNIVGGIIGGIVGIGLLSGVFVYHLQRKRRSDPANIIPEAEGQPCNLDPSVSQAQATHNVNSGRSGRPLSSTSLPLAPDRRRPLAEISIAQTLSTPLTQVPPSAPLPPAANSSSPERDPNTRLELPNPSLIQSLSGDGRVDESSTRELPPSLTDEQVDFITGLYNNNVPAPAVARVMQRMLADRQAGVREWEREIGSTRSHSTPGMTPPPSYHTATRRL